MNHERHGHPGFYDLLQKMADLHSRKNHDYAGDSDPLRNFRKSLALGVTPFAGVMVRLSDKWSRLESFMQQGILEVKEESVEDTLLDNAVYSLLAILLYREEKDEDRKQEQIIDAGEQIPTDKKAPVVSSTSDRLSHEHPWAGTTFRNEVS